MSTLSVLSSTLLGRTMTTRRRFAAGVVAAAAGGRLAGRAFAQGATPVATPVVPDMTGAVHRFMVGAFECLAVSDGADAPPNLAMLLFAGSPTEEVEQALREGGST